MSHLLVWIVMLPLAGFVINGLLGRRFGNRFVSVVGCGLPIASCVLVCVCTGSMLAGNAPLIQTVFTWASFGERTFDVAFYFDRLSAVMALIVTGVGSLIHVYSIGYMKGDDGYARFFAYLN